jgi:hypothetical protein
MARPEIIKAREESRDAATTLRIEIIALEEMIMDMANYSVWRAIVDFLEES